jgi:hypothetical protein
MRTQLIETTTSTPNRQEVAELMNKVARKLLDAGDALLEKKASFTQSSLNAYFMKCPWVTSGTYELIQPWGSGVDRDGLDAYFMKSTWLTSGS